MNNYFLNILGQKRKVINKLNRVYHAPLIVDASSQNCYRKEGHVSWPVNTDDAKQDPAANATIKILRKWWMQIAVKGRK